MTLEQRFPGGHWVEYVDDEGGWREWEYRDSSGVLRRVGKTGNYSDDRNQATAALSAAVAEEESIEGLQLDYGKNSARRTRQSFVEDCPAIKANPTVTPTHVITTTVGGVRVKLLAQIDEE